MTASPAACIGIPCDDECDTALKYSLKRCLRSNPGAAEVGVILY